MKQKQKMFVGIVAAAIFIGACTAGIVAAAVVRNREYVNYRALYQDTYKSMAEIYVVLRNNGEYVLLDSAAGSPQEGAPLWFGKDEVVSTQERYEQLWQQVRTQIQQLAELPHKEKQTCREYYDKLQTACGNMQEMEQMLREPVKDKKAFQSSWKVQIHSVDTAFEFIYQGFPISRKKLDNSTFLKLAAYWSANVLEISKN